MAVRPTEDNTRAKCTQVIMNDGREEDGQSYHCRSGSAIEPRGKQLPPSCIAEPPGVHLSHVAHSYYPDHKAIKASVESLGRHCLEVFEKCSNQHESHTLLLASRTEVEFQAVAQDKGC